MSTSVNTVTISVEDFDYYRGLEEKLQKVISDKDTITFEESFYNWKTKYHIVNPTKPQTEASQEIERLGKEIKFLEENIRKLEVEKANLIFRKVKPIKKSFWNSLF